jgi:hypothetical protein
MWGILNISLYIFLVTLLMSVLILMLLQGAYRAYNGIAADAISLDFTSARPATQLTEGSYTEESKIQIIAAFFPFVGTILAQQDPLPEILIGRKVSNFLVFFTLLIGIITHSSTFAFFCTILSILLVVVTGVYLFLFSRFLQFSFYDWIPSYIALEAHIETILWYTTDILRIAFG